MSKNKDIIRKNIYIPSFVDEWVKKESRKRGLSESTLISLTLQEAIKQEKAINTVSNLDRLVEEIKKLKEV